MTDLRSPTQNGPDTATGTSSPGAVRLRRAAIAVWALVVATLAGTRVMSFGFVPIMVVVVTGLAAASIGRRNPLLVVRDWLPFGLVLFAYESTRGTAAFLGMPTRWHLAVDADRWMFGVVPTVWLQEHLKHADPQWWEIITSVVYMSYFIVPYALAGWLWLRDRTAWKKFVTRFVALFFLGLVGYILVPAAPPWAAAQCTAEQVVGGPAFPPCITGTPENVPGGGVLGPMTPDDPAAKPFIERISSRGWDVLHIGPVRDVIEVGQERSNQVAAIPSLHAGLTGLLAMFMWRRVGPRGRILWVGYAAAMAFTLVYSAEHYVFDLILGWSLAALVMVGCAAVERRWARRTTRHGVDEGRDQDDPVGATRAAGEPSVDRVG